MIEFSQRPFTYRYSQPDNYHFCLESVEMPLRIAERIGFAEDLSNKRAVDICAGCGIIGFDFHYHCPSIGGIDFVELQNEYREHFEKNRHTVGGSEDRFRFLNMNYEALLAKESEGLYDIVLCNPPFFRSDHGLLSPFPFKNRCRFFMDSSFEKLIEVIVHVLKPGGDAFLQVRNLREHQLDAVEEIETLSAGKLKCIDKIAVRKSTLVCLKK